MLSRSAGGLLAVALAISLPSAFHPAAAAVGSYDEQIHAYDVVLSGAPHMARSVAEPSALAPPTDAGEVDQVSDTACGRSFWFMDRDATWAEFRFMFQDQTALVETVDPDIFPLSYRLDLTDLREGEAVIAAIENLPGIRKVVHAEFDWPSDTNASPG